MLVRAPNSEPRWLPEKARRGYINMRRSKLSHKYGLRQWTWKGIITRIFGQGIQRVFKALPASKRAAISGSMAVAIFDMMQDKRDLSWMPNDVDVFVAIPRKNRRFPLATLFPIMNKWLESVRDQGFLYKLKSKGACYSTSMCIFDFECTNATNFPDMHLPKISFIAHPEESVRDICDNFDLSICGPILRRRNKDSPIDIEVTNEISQLFKQRMFYSKIRPTRRTRGGLRTLQRVHKYKKREFMFFKTDYDNQPFITSDDSFKLPRYGYRPRLVCKRFILLTLGREPTEQETINFNICR